MNRIARFSVAVGLLVLLGSSPACVRCSDDTPSPAGRTSAGAPRRDDVYFRRPDKARKPAVDPDLVYEAFYYASLYPERFDSYAAENLSRKKAAYLRCVNYVQTHSIPAWFREETDHCQKISPEYQEGCYDVDSVKVGIMLDSMTAVVQGTSSYCGTMTGMGACMGKQMLGPDMWLALQKEVVPIFRPALQCK